jgi:hypothetical protein
LFFMTTTAQPRAEMLCQMAECAYRLGKAFGAAAEQADDLETRLKWFLVFERCFFALRVSTALELRLKQAPKEPREAASDREDLADRETLAEREPRDRGDDERDRDRDGERASFPILIRTLEGVAADAAALPGPAPAELLNLRELLAQVKAEPAAAAPSQPTGLRARLTGSSAATAVALTPRPPPGLTTRRATGPP